MSRAVLITVRFHDARFHGRGDWPPSPARLFQALVPGAGLRGPLNGEDSAALEWLQGLDPPLIACPVKVDGQSFVNYVPNNDLDAKGGDAGRIASIRTTKPIKPRLFHAGAALLYAWGFDDHEEGEDQALAVCALAERLYQFGRGVDMAWACGEVLENGELDARLSVYPGVVYRPSNGGNGRKLACARQGSLASLRQRYAANSQRFTTEGRGKAARQLFSQSPKPRFEHIAYDSPPLRRVYELRERSTEATFGTWPLVRASKLVEWLRDGAAERLRRALPQVGAAIERVLVGRKPNGADDGPTSLRVMIVPLPSIGHQHADHGIRRVLVEVPAGCPIRADDVHWAFSGLELCDLETGEVLDLALTPSNDKSMLAHYGVEDRVQARTWRTVTPAALPGHARRRRIDPARVVEEAKNGVERATELRHATAAVVHALRHAEVRPRPEFVRVQREPFEARGERAEAFATGTRFAKERLWHVEITFNAPIAGPLAIGNGRFLGLGVMAPFRRAQGVHTFAIEGGLAATAQAAKVTRALRRAVMARVQEVLGLRTTLPTFFTGHERDGSPAQTGHHHLSFVFDPVGTRLLILPPHVSERRAATREELRHLETLEEALTHFREVRAGSAGRLMLRASLVDQHSDPLFAASRTWESVTPYEVTRHTKHVGAAEALSADLGAECRRRGLPEPRVMPREWQGVPGVGLVGSAHLTFEVAIEGPIVLGRSHHLGGGLFAGTASLSRTHSSPTTLWR
jgi:CRISPR-associated protein Csb2